ncbi:hypothetical protein ACWDYH_00565 [Nocardia goodfellowii]
MTVTNWLGQTIEVGTIVGRGARDGNTSSFKVGRVVSLKPDRKARVHWLVEPGYSGEQRRELVSFGNPSVDTLFVLDPATFGFKLPGADE